MTEVRDDLISCCCATVLFMAETTMLRGKMHQVDVQ